MSELPQERYLGPERRRAGENRAVRELARRQLAALSHAAGEMVTARTVGQVTAIAVQAAVTAVGAEGGTVAVRDGQALQLVSTGHYNPALQQAYPRLALSAALPVCHAARTGERLLLGTRQAAVERFPQVAEHQDLTDRAGARIVSAAVIPLRGERGLLGSLTVTWSVERLFSDGDVELLEALAALVARAVDRVESAIERDRVLARASLLARAGDLLTAGLDQQAVCAALVQLVVPDLAQQAVVELVGGNGSVARTVQHSALSQVGAVQALLPRQAAPVDGPLVGAGAPDSAGGAGGRCVVPLVAAGRRLGSLTASRLVGLPYSPVERELLRLVADRAALAVQNAALFAEQRETSLALQQALLTEPPPPGRLHVVVRYQPASHAAVGGDWYDAIVTPDGATVLVIGDVVGHDARAAASMGQLRALLRTIAYTGGDGPAAVLTRTEQAAQGLAVAALATAVVARVEQPPALQGGGLVLRWSNAGHPPPALLRADGTVCLLEGEPDLMLGVQEGTFRADHTVELADGDTLLLYTDGLIERRDAPLEAGLRHLLEQLADLGRCPPGVLCDALLARLAQQGPEDDVALLAVRVNSPPE